MRVSSADACVLRCQVLLNGLCDVEEVPAAGVWLLPCKATNSVIQLSLDGTTVLSAIGEVGMFKGPSGVAFAPGRGVFVVDNCGRQYQAMATGLK